MREAAQTIAEMLIRKDGDNYVVPVVSCTACAADESIRPEKNLPQPVPDRTVTPLDVYNMVDLLHTSFGLLANSAFVTLRRCSEEYRYTRKIRDTVDGALEDARTLAEVPDEFDKVYGELERAFHDAQGYELREAYELVGELPFVPDQNFAAGPVILALAGEQHLLAFHQRKQIPVPPADFVRFSQRAQYLISSGQIDSLFNRAFSGFEQNNLQKMLLLCQDARSILPEELITSFIIYANPTRRSPAHMQRLRRESSGSRSYLHLPDIRHSFTQLRGRNPALRNITKFLHYAERAFEEVPWTQERMTRCWRRFGLEELVGIIVGNES